MARLTPIEWRTIRKAYEVDLMSSTKLSKQYGVAESTICRRMHKEGWNREKMQDAIEKRVSSIKVLAEITQDNASQTQVICNEADRRLRLEGIFMDSLEYNQALANSIIKRKKKDGTAELNDVQAHSQITNRNKDGVLGKMPSTVVNIQNNNGTDVDAVLERLRNRHAS